MKIRGHMKRFLILSQAITLLILLPSLAAPGEYSRTNKTIIQLYSTEQTEVAAKLEVPPIIKENSVVFYCISQEDFDELIKDPDRRGDIIETISDFNHYALMVAEKLEGIGIATEFVSDKEIWFELPTGIIEKRTFNPKDDFQLALFPKGKPPLIVRSRSSSVDDGIIANYDSLIEAISDYFGINLNQSNINWDEIRRAFGSYCQSPSSGKAIWILSIMPKSFDNRTADHEQWTSTVDYIYEHERFSVLERGIRKGDSFATRIAFKTLNISDGAFTQSLCALIAESIRANPTVFLEELKALFESGDEGDLVYSILRDDLDTDILAIEENPQAKQEYAREINLRIKSLETVTRPDLIDIRNYCLRKYRAMFIAFS
jgi:hypothetical protein